MSRPSLSRALLLVCTCGAAATGGVLIGVLTPAGAQSTGSSEDSSTAVPGPCAAVRRPGDDGTLPKLAGDLGVSADRLAPALGVAKQTGDDPHGAAFAQALAGQLGLDPARVQAVLAADLPGPQIVKTPSGAAVPAAKLQYLQSVAKGTVRPCSMQVPAPADNLKLQALQALAADLGVSGPRLMAALETAGAQGIDSPEDPGMAAALAGDLGIDESTVQRALATMLSRPPFSGAQMRVRRRP
jgi:hypothetical protein